MKYGAVRKFYQPLKTPDLSNYMTRKSTTLDIFFLFESKKLFKKKDVGEY